MKATPLTGNVQATCVTDEELVLEQALERIQYELELQIEVEEASEHGETWTSDYKEGYIDGLKRALELMPDAIASECDHIDFEDNLTGGTCNTCGAEWSSDED